MVRKKAFIIGLIVLAIIFCLGLIIYRYMTKSSKTKDLALALGNELIASLKNGENISSAYAVYIGEDLRSALNTKRYSFIKGYTVDCYPGDASYPFGDGKAQYQLIMKGDNKAKPIILRLKYDNDLKKFHILGFYTGN